MRQRQNEYCFYSLFSHHCRCTYQTVKTVHFPFLDKYMSMKETLFLGIFFEIFELFLFFLSWIGKNHVKWTIPLDWQTKKGHQ